MKEQENKTATPVDAEFDLEKDGNKIAGGVCNQLGALADIKGENIDAWASKDAAAANNGKAAAAGVVVNYGSVKESAGFFDMQAQGACYVTYTTDAGNGSAESNGSWFY